MSLFPNTYIHQLPPDLRADILSRGDVDPHLYCYENGLYDVGNDVFWQFDSDSYDKESYAAEIQQYRRENGWGSDYTVKPPDKLPIQYFEREFRFEITPCTERYFDANEIELPEFEYICRGQGIDHETQKWLLVFLGRSFFRTGERDNWQISPFIKGEPGPNPNPNNADCV